MNLNTPSVDSTSAETPAPGTEKKDILQFLEQTNIAKGLDEDTLRKIGSVVSEGYKADLRSRKQWELDLEGWTKLALQVREERTYPWPKASNVKYPLLSTAAMQFSARAFPALIPANGEVVKAEVVGYDPMGEKAKRAERVGKHMSYQLTKKMQGWEADMDKLLITLPIVGTCFKKTYWDANCQEMCSKLVMPKDLVINYWASSMETAERKTERIFMPKRLVTERINNEIFLDVDLPDPADASEASIDKDKTEQTRSETTDDSVPYLICEQHTFYDLDEDGYPEPYIITFEESSGKVLRITARFDQEGVDTDAKGNILKIKPVEYYTKYEFIPNPDGGFYGIGFGLLLGTLNESVNTIINQLVDAGTLSNLQSGFIGKGLRIKMGEARFQPGEWKAVNATSDDLKKQIFPLPVREPSNVLFQLLGTLITSAKELASVAEIFVGKMPGQNTPATTTMATIEQGMKVFTAIYKRVYRAMTEEFKKLYRLNRIYFDPREEQQILDTEVSQNDYDDTSYDICPAADPNAISQSEKMAKFESAMQLMALGTLDPVAVTMRGLEAFEIPNPQELMRKGPPPPDPKQQEAQAKMQIEQQKAQIKAAEAQMKMQIEAMKAEMEQKSRQAQMAMEAQMNAMKLQFEQAKQALEMRKAHISAQSTALQAQQDVQASGLKHAQALRQGDEKHQAAMKQSQEKTPKNDKK